MFYSNVLYTCCSLYMQIAVSKILNSKERSTVNIVNKYAREALDCVLSMSGLNRIANATVLASLGIK